MDDAIAYYCISYAEPHDMFRAFLLAHPDADVAWTLAEDGSTDVLMTDRTQRTFRRWHQAQEEAAMPPRRTAWLMAEKGLTLWGWPPV